MKFTFPFNSCEIPTKSVIAQPYSSLVNLINCLVIVYFLVKTNTHYAFLLIASILCFELFHLFSHSIHITGATQTIVIHTLTYFINIAFFYAFYSYTTKLPSTAFIIYLLLLIGLDIYALLNLNIFYYIATQSIVFISLLFYYFTWLPVFVQTSMCSIIACISVILLLVLNEKYNCKRMLKQFPKFPFHIFIEIVGIVLFYIICSTFYKL
jgi:hypothetical protein